MDLTKRRLIGILTLTAAPTTLAGCLGRGSNFELQDVRVENGFIRLDEKLTVAATVENVGDTARSTSIEFNLDVHRTIEETDELEPRERRQVITDVELPPLIDPGRYDLVVALEDDQSVSTPVDLIEEIDDPGIYGSVVTEADASIEGVHITYVADGPGETFDSDNLRIDADNWFNRGHPIDGEYTLSLTFNSTSGSPPRTGDEFDGVPALYDFERDRQINGSVEILGQYELPRGYRTEIQVIDENGDPVSDFDPINFRTENGVGLGLNSFTTDDEGFVIAQGGTETGISLPPEDVSNITFGATNPDGPGDEVFRTVFGSEEGEEFTVEVSAPDRFR